MLPSEPSSKVLAAGSRGDAEGRKRAMPTAILSGRAAPSPRYRSRRSPGAFPGPFYGCRMSIHPRRTRIVPVRMTDAEHAEAAACARTLGISLSRLMRSRAEALPPLRASTDLAAAAALGRIGSNLNQLVHLLHLQNDVPSSELIVVLFELRELVTDLRGRLRS